MLVRATHLSSLLIVLLLTACGVSAIAQSDEEVAPSGYRLGEGDRISIQVFDEPDLTMGARIGAGGVINYSYLGDLKVAGKTPVELEREITQALSDGFLVNPSVNVTIDEFRPFFINGEVRNPGGYSYQPGLTLDKAIALAGGMTDRASRRKIYIVRASSGSEKPFKVDTSAVIEPGDIISIQEGFF